MNITKAYWSSLLIKKNSKGFTLIELLVAVVMSGIVMAGLGAGMMAVLNSSKKTNAKTDVKNQLNRAVEYINEDIKRSRVAGISSINEPSNKNNAVVLTYFESLNNSTAHTITYYIDDVDANGPWLGPKILRRKVDNGNWQVLVDRLTENDQTTFACAAPNLSTDSDVGGFQACIESATGNSGSAVYRTTIALAGEIFDTTGTSLTSETIEVSTDTISRSVTPNLAPPVLSFSPETDLTPTLTWDITLGAESYQIYKCRTADLVTSPCTPSSAEEIVYTGSGTSVTDNDDDTSSPWGEHYCYAGVSRNGTEQSVIGEKVCTIKSPAAAPSNTSDLIVSDEVQPNLTWSRQEDALDYAIYRCQTTNVNVPCAINTAVLTPIFEFTAATDTAFDVYEPWYEARNTNALPAEGKAFCYGVVSTNARGSSSLSNIDCGAINQPLALNASWNVQFTSFNTLAIEPQNMEWNSVSGNPNYELYRCETAGGGATCNPSTEGSSIQESGTRTFSETISPAGNLKPSPGKGYCYAVRAKSSTQISAFSTTKCAKERPKQCTLPLESLGLGSTTNNYKATDTSAKRATLQALVNSGNTDGQQFTVTTVNAQSAVGAVLHTILENSSGSSVSAYTGADSRTLPCNTTITLKWYAPDLGEPGPDVAITPPSPLGGYQTHTPRLTWATPTSPNRVDVYRCQTSSATVACVPGLFSATSLTSPSPWQSTFTPANGSRICYGLKLYNGSTSSDLGNVVCGTVR